MNRRERIKLAAQNAKEKAKFHARRVKEKTKMRVSHAKQQAKVVKDKAVRLFRINLANTLTLLNGVSGFFSIIAAIDHQYFLAAIMILCGVVFDWLDGKAARAFSETSDLGRELDSLSDLISFGVAPAVLVCRIAPSLLTYAAGALFVLSAALRLGRFNVQKLQGVYFGLPTTTNGLLLPAMIFLGAPIMVFPWYLLCMAFMMNVPLKIKKVL